MKTRLTISLLLIFIFNTAIHANKPQNLKETARVYFVRASGLGALVNFTYFDGNKAIGKFNGPKYMIYECEPGNHIFWVRSENKSFIEANLEAGKNYLIDVIPQMGAFKAGMMIIPVDKNDYKLKKIQKLVSKQEPEVFSPEDLAILQNEMQSVIERGIKKINNPETLDIVELSAEMTIEAEDLIYTKKKK